MAYSESERQEYLVDVTEKITSFPDIEGIVQIGSGVNGFSDEYSDIDLMVGISNLADPEQAKASIKNFFEEMHPIYIKEKQFGKDIFLLIVFLHNGLEFNVSVASLRLLSVKSPLWKVLTDKTGAVVEKMNHENELFLQETVQYGTGMDLPFEFAYCAQSAKKALKRDNPLYALQMLETMRTYLLYLQAMNEQKKVHQFKAYDTLDSGFIERFLMTYPTENTIEHLEQTFINLIELWQETLQKSTMYRLEDGLEKLLQL